MGKSSFAIKALLVVNIGLFAISYFVTELKFNDSLALYFIENDKFHVWQFITSMFMHNGIAHILFNMYALWAFGTPLEQMWGSNRFLLFFLLSGIGAGLVYTAVNYFQFHSIYNELIAAGIAPTEIQSFLKTETSGFGQRIEIPATMSAISTETLSQFWQLFNTSAVGASGAIYGVLVAFGMSFPNAKLALIFFPVPIAAKYFIPVLIGLDLFSGITGTPIFGMNNIAYFAHVGGAIVGFLLMWFWRKRNNNDVVIIQQ